MKSAEEKKLENSEEAKAGECGRRRKRKRKRRRKINVILSL